MLIKLPHSSENFPIKIANLCWLLKKSRKVPKPPKLLSACQLETSSESNNFQKEASCRHAPLIRLRRLGTSYVRCMTRGSPWLTLIKWFLYVISFSLCLYQEKTQMRRRLSNWKFKHQQNIDKTLFWKYSEVKLALLSSTESIKIWTQ